MVKTGKRAKRYFLAVVPGDAKADLSGLEDLTDGTYASFASPEKADALSGSADGAILPFSFHPALEPVVDPGVPTHPEVFFNAARPDRSPPPGHAGLTRPPRPHRRPHPPRRRQGRAKEHQDASARQENRSPCRHGPLYRAPGDTGAGASGRRRGDGNGAGMQVFLTTDRMVLRRITPEDAPLLLGLDSDPEVMRYLTGGRPSAPSEVDRNIRTYQEWYRTSPDRGYWIAQDAGDGAFLGWFHLRHPRGGDPAEPELGYRLARAHWGRGLATEGSRALLGTAFADPSVRRVFARTMAVNTGSRRVMEKLGMRLVRTFALDAPPIPGSEHGEVEYALTRADHERAGAGRGPHHQSAAHSEPRPSPPEA